MGSHGSANCSAGFGPESSEPALSESDLSVEADCGDGFAQRLGTNNANIAVAIWRIGGNDNAGEPEAGSFGEPASSLADLTEFAAETDLAEHCNISRHWLVAQCADHCEADTEVEAWLDEFHTARRGGIDVVLADREPRTAAEYRHEHREACAIETQCAPPGWHAGNARRGQRLDLDHDWALPFHGWDDS